MTKLRTINQLARVEGHGRIRLEQQAGRVVGARLELYESMRLFEALVLGRRYDEIAEIVCRICSICSTVHKVAALQAVEHALELQVSTQTDLLRQLAVQGGQIESHALHLFCLALPDYLGCNGFPELAQRAPAELQRGLEIKALGNRIQELVGGRAIHPFNLLLGGLGSVPAADSLKQLIDQLQELLPAALATIELAAGLNETLPALHPLPCCAASGGPSLFGEQLTTSDGQQLAACEAYAWLDERLVGYSHAKLSSFSEHGPYLVGPLARLNLDVPLEPSAQAALQRYDSRLLGAPLTASHLARAIELLQAIERAMVLCRQLLQNGLLPERAAAVQPRSGSGTALIEAPRGLLLHQYSFNDAGYCTAAQVVTPTAINQGAMALMLTDLLQCLPDADPDSFKLQAERLIRCFDPCISCAVH
ncbi:Ni/Fe hydrogenase subunit alpha [Trichlorobacter sp.]|uniref:Ni/Fe hydrogenase subunit alpha n=1 Tax=Trichlorobacter sp. TaxID=2911007 RepID=UPI002A36D966|nr:Ni/Fe hydrogenase subunit alpha [Trichlorobacter sp.]MDY0385203.1 Ni/Fe hydrogenase subunit alpha [Trichlorobacter sp.]